MIKFYIIALLAFGLNAAAVLNKPIPWHVQNSSFAADAKRAYLVQVIKTISKVKSATYLATHTSYAPGDTTASVEMSHIVKEFDNPADTTIGASFVALLQADTTKMFSSYDGNMKAFVDWKRNYMTIDSFQVTRTPFRTLQAPFFNYTRSIIRHAVETKDSTSIDLQDLGESVLVTLNFYGAKQVEFFGKAYYINSPFSFGEEVSTYSIWVNKKTNLPFRVRREMSHNTSEIICKEVKLNKLDIKGFVAKNYFPANILLSNGPQMVDNSLLGKPAPKWDLVNAHNKNFSLDKSKAKVVLIQFTSVSCGPCRVSIPFMNELSSEFKKGDVDVVSIESFSRNPVVLQKYQDKTGINYNFLMSTDEVTKSYKIDAVPVFFILDKNRVIRGVINGYGGGSTDKKIREAIKDLM